jgi:hypothetical protein
MAFKNNGSTADAALYELFENRFACHIALMRVFGIVGYWRFKDDILFIATDEDRGDNFYHELCN